MDHHSWRPPPIQGNNINNNICPTCYIAHFPFCPPLPHPSTYPGPTFDPSRGPARPIYQDPSYHDPGYWSKDPSLAPPPPHMGDHSSSIRGGGSYAMPNYGNGYLGSDYSSSNNCNVNVNDDRSSKRLRVDDGMYHPGPRCGDGGANLLRPPVVDDGRRLNLGHDHGGPGPEFAQENLGFGRNVVGLGWEVGYPNSVPVRGASNVEMGLGYGVNCSPGYGMKRSAAEVERDHHVGQYGQGVQLQDPNSFRYGGVGYGRDRPSYGQNQPSIGSNVEHMGSNNAGVQYEQRSNMPVFDQYSASRPPVPAAQYQPGHMGYDYQSPRPHFSGSRPQLEARPSPGESYQNPFGNQNVIPQPQFRSQQQGGYGYPSAEHTGHLPPPQGFDVRPPLPTSPPPPLPMEPPTHWSAEHRPASSPARPSSSLFPVTPSSSAAVHSPHTPIPESHARANSHHQNSPIGYGPRGTFHGDSQDTLRTYGQHHGSHQQYPSKTSLPDKPKVVDATELFKAPHRASRPDYFVVILRGLPGSGKSYLAKMLRDLEVEHGGNAPRIHSMDDYFMTEVEKIEANESSRSFGRGKKPMMKKVLEYCYEPEMEEAYRSSMLKAFKKTLEEGAFTFVIVDDRNLRVADFAQFWATAKRSGYEAYLLEAPYKDPVGCTARNVHGFTQDDVEKMAAQWEEAPSLYLQLDVKSLFHGDDLKKSGIQEVDMDTEDVDFDETSSNLNEKDAEGTSLVENLRLNVSQQDERHADAEVGNSVEEVKYLGRSKWSDNLDDDDDERTEALKSKGNVLSGLLGTYGKEGKSVHWGDQGARSGFSIGAVKKANMSSLVIGPGAGYNLKSNPLPDKDAMTGKSGQQKHNVFQERLRAEQESFRAVFDKRRQHIGGVLAEED